MEDLPTAQILSFPNASARPRTGKHDASANVQKRFRDKRGVDKAVFHHLAYRVHDAIVLLQERYGERSGALHRAFGDNFLKQKKRFSLRPDETPRNICQNPGNWMHILEGLARELGEDPDNFILDVFTGSTLLPGRTSSNHSKAAWFADFLELIDDMSASLAAEADFASVRQYLCDSALMVEDGKLVVTELQEGTPFIDERFEYRPEQLDQLPHSLGLNFQAHFDYPVMELDVAVFADMVAASDSALELPNDGSYQVESGIRSGMAFALDARTGNPALALFEWRVAHLSIVDGAGEVIFSAPMPWELNEQITGGVESEHGRIRLGAIRFSFPGSDQFEAVAARHIVFPEIWVDDGIDLLWDPGGYVDSVEGYPTSAPGRTVAAAIERNLLYAATEGETGKRLDNILRAQIRGLVELLNRHRTHEDATIAAARTALRSEWTATTGKERQ